MKDIYIKDEGDFATVIFQTPNAIEALNKQSKEVITACYGISNNCRKLDIDNGQVPNIVAFASSHGLSIDSEVTVCIVKKPDWFDRERKVREHAAQSGWDFATGNPAYYKKSN